MHHLQEVQRQSGAVGPAAGGEAVGDGVDDQQIGHAHRDQLAQLPVRRIRSTEINLCVAAGDAGEPGEEGGGREKDLQKYQTVISLFECSVSATEDGRRMIRPFPACFASRRCRSCTDTEPEQSRTGRRPRPRSPGGRGSDAPAPSGTAAGELQRCNEQLWI